MSEEELEIAYVEGWVFACRAQLVADEARTASAYKAAQQAWSALAKVAQARGLEQDRRVYQGCSSRAAARRLLAMLSGRP